MGQVSLRGIRKSYGDVHVIKGVDLEVHDGVRANDLRPSDGDAAMVFQSYALYPHITVAENMGFALKMAGVSREKRDDEVRNARRHSAHHRITRPLPQRIVWRAAPTGIPAKVVLAEHLGDSSILHLRLDGVTELLNAKVGTDNNQCESGAAVGLVPDAAWALSFDAAGRLLRV